MTNLQNQKIDRRVSRTRRNLQEAMFALILEKGYDSVTVEEITSRADVGRTTFYLHYRDKEDLLVQTVSDVVDDLVNQLARYPVEDLRHRTDAELGWILLPVISLAFQHVEQNADLYRILLRGEGSYNSLQRLRQILRDAIESLIQHFTARQNQLLSPQVPLDVFLSSLAGAWIGLLAWWIEKDMPYTSEQMAVMYQRMFMRSTLEVLGLAGEEEDQEQSNFEVS
ncbi:MAG: TetR/AcrR family transcriptional regulator [Anaerolineales bacterium]